MALILFFSRLGEYLDCFFPTAGPGFPSLRKDLINLLKDVEVTIECILASIDVNSLYTNIKQSYAFEALQKTNLKRMQKEF